MIKEKEINICGKQVSMRYCLEAEEKFEEATGKSIEVFNPEVKERDDAGKPTKIEPAKATKKDYKELAYAAIEAAYERNGQKPPVEKKDVQYNASSEEVLTLIAAVIELRMLWYNIPAIVKPEIEETEEDQRKNA